MDLAEIAGKIPESLLVNVNYKKLVVNGLGWEQLQDPNHLVDNSNKWISFVFNYFITFILFLFLLTFFLFNFFLFLLWIWWLWTIIYLPIFSFLFFYFKLLFNPLFSLFHLIRCLALWIFFEMEFIYSKESRPIFKFIHESFCIFMKSRKLECSCQSFGTI